MKTGMTMHTKSYADAAAFLKDTQAPLESSEPANSLMLGLCMRLVQHPERIKDAPCLKTVHDEQGLVLAAMMTAPRPIIVYGPRSDLGQAARVLVQDLVSEGWRIPGVRGPSEAATEVALAWTEITGQGHRLVQRTIAHELRQVLTPTPTEGRLRPATEADGELVTRWAYGFDMDCHGYADWEEAAQVANMRIGDGDLYLWDLSPANAGVKTQPVSMAIKNRPTRHGTSISLVYTPPGFRRQGYAAACVSELSRLLLGTGYEFCALFADVANPTANHIYREMGYRPLGEYHEYAFAED
jgi:predicted GNAT family acetyltransferase